MPRHEDEEFLLLEQVNHDGYLSSLSPLLTLRYNEISGTTVKNYGSLGAAQDGAWTAGAGAQGQASPLGQNQAYDHDGLNSKVTVPATAAINNLTALTYGIFFKADTFGELSLGGFFLDTAENRQFRFNTSGAIRGILTATGAANSISANSFVSTGVWTYLLMTYDDAGERKMRFYKGVSGVLTEATYTTHTAASGTLGNGGGDLVVGNAAGQNVTFDGLISRAFVLGRMLPLDLMSKLMEALAA